MNASRRFTVYASRTYFVAVGLTLLALLSACGNNTTPPSLSGDALSNQVPGTGTTVGADPTLVSGTAPSLTGVPTSAQAAAAAGLQPNQIPSNYDFNALMAAWAQQWGAGSGALNPANLPSALQQMIQSLYCSYSAGGAGMNPLAFDLIMGYYLDVLYRFGEQSGVQSWISKTNIYDQSSRYNTAWGFISSNEGNGNFINRGYYGFLRRAPGSSEVSYWNNRITNQGLELEDFYASLGQSNEYYQASYAGQSKLQTWIHALYRDILGRSEQPWENSFWVNQYNTNGGSRYKIAQGFEYSDENHLKFITNSYLYYLNRMPTGTELQTAFKQFKSGSVHMRQFMAQMLATTEYMNRQPARFNTLTGGSCN